VYYRYDLKRGQATVDFAPGIAVTGQDIRRAIARAGFTPGPITLTYRPTLSAEDRRSQPEASGPAAQILHALSRRKTHGKQSF